MRNFTHGICRAISVKYENQKYEKQDEEIFVCCLDVNGGILR